MSCGARGRFIAVWKMANHKIAAMMRPMKVDAANPLNFTVWKQLFPEAPTKSQQTQIRIAEAAIRLYAKEGAQATIFESIAQAAKVSRALILRYFPTYQSLMMFMAKYIRAQLQELAVQRLTAADGPKAQLEAYIDATFEWIEVYPHHVKVWLYFYYLCSLDKKTRDLNTELVDIGHKRIQKMIEEGQKAGVFPKGNATASAKAVQTLITGSLLSCLSENRKEDLQKIRKGTQRACRACLSIND